MTSKLLIAGVVLLALLNTALFLSGKEDLRDSAVLVGTLVAGIVTQAVIVAVVYGLYRLIRRSEPRQSWGMIALRTLFILAVVKVFTMIVPPARLRKPGYGVPTSPATQPANAR